MLRRLQLAFALACALLAGPALALGPTNLVAQGQTTSLAGNTYVGTSSTTCPAGAVAVAITGIQTQALTAFADDVDGLAWTQVGNAASTAALAIYKRIVPAPGYTTSTHFTATVTFGSSPSAYMVVDCYTDGTSIPTSADAGSVTGQNTGGSGTLSSIAPSLATSYQIAAFSASTTTGAGGPNPDPSSTGSWTLSQTINVGNYGVNVFWRKASNTSPVTLTSNFGGFSNYYQGWAEVGTSAPAAAVDPEAFSLLGVQ